MRQTAEGKSDVAKETLESCCMDSHVLLRSGEPGALVWVGQEASGETDQTPSTGE